MKKRAIIYTPFLLGVRLWHQLWVRVSLMAVLALLVSVAAMYLEAFLPYKLRASFGFDSVMPVLTILASGMLAVSTFSLNVMVTAYQAAAAQATPRAHRILLNDTTTQTVLAAFIGAFVYSLSAIILLKAGLHAESSAVILMVTTVAVVVLVIFAMLRWIDHLSDLGSMDATLHTIETQARTSLMKTRTTPCLSASPLTEDTIIPAQAVPLAAPASGHLQLINVPGMSRALPSAGAHVWMTSPPGTFVLEGQTVGYVNGLDKAEILKVQNALSIGDNRTFEQDATYGLLVLSEIASRALSPGVNDPGTAIDVIARQERLLWNWAHAKGGDTPADYPQVFIAALTPAKLIENAFAGIARDGAAMVEVTERLLHALESMQDAPEPRMGEAAQELAARARAYADKAMVLEVETDRIARG